MDVGRVQLPVADRSALAWPEAIALMVRQILAERDPQRQAALFFRTLSELPRERRRQSTHRAEPPELDYTPHATLLCAVLDEDRATRCRAFSTK